jgi:hypothetical protein
VQIFFLPLGNLCDSYEGDPLSPPEGEAAQGEHPLDPRFFINLLRAIIVLGDARAAGAEAQSAGVPKSDFMFLLRVSTEQKMCNILFIKLIARMGLYPLKKKRPTLFMECEMCMGSLRYQFFSG